ncbi:MAG: hypothetical protein F6K58_19945 [Symploca sp. SIO2E9]|nr:hypothetical protein [Symploca sp. SIO2E9]
MSPTSLGIKAEIESKSYYSGEFDGQLGLNPSKPQCNAYWQGYCTGLRQRWLNLKKIDIPTEF